MTEAFSNSRRPLRVLITGGTGYIGSCVALDLARRGHAVTAVARPLRSGTTTDARADELRAAGVSFAHADLSHPGELARAVEPERYDYIVHGVCSFLEPAEGESLTLRAMTESLALAAKLPEKPCVVDLSSALVLAPPKPDDFPDERYACAPDTAHGLNKLVAERMLSSSGFPWLILRVGQVYGGVGSSFDWVMIDPIRRGEFPVPCDGRNRVALVHVDDVALAVRLCLEAGARNKIYNVAAGERDLTLGAVFDVIAAGFGLPSPRRLPRAGALAFAWLSERVARLRGRDPALVPDMVRVLANNRSLSTALICDELGFKPAHPDTIAGIRASYADVFAGRAAPFAPPGRLSHAQGKGPPR